MTTNLSPLHQAFLDDHRRMTRGLFRIRNALKADDLGLAVRTADEIDQLVGPHIQFEEEIYYPALRKTLGGGFVDQLYREHEIGRHAIQSLRDRQGRERLDDEERDTIVGEIDAMLEHALSCGTLLSHLEILTEEEKAKMLAQLHEFREHAQRWCELPTRAPAPT